MLILKFPSACAAMFTLRTSITSQITQIGSANSLYCFGKRRSETTQVLSSILSVTRILGRQRNLYGFKLAAEELPTSELSSVIEILSQLTIAEKLIIFYALADVAPEQNSNIHKFAHISSPLQMIQWMSHRSPMIRMSQWQLPPIIPIRGNWRCNLEEP